MLNESSPAVWKGTLAICFLIVVLTSGTTNLAAQSPAEFGDLPDISGTWNRVSRSNPPACGPSFVIEEDERQLPRFGCRFDWSDHINARTRAWRAFYDEPLEGKFYCVPESIPSTMGWNNPIRIVQRADRVIWENPASNAYTIDRTIWTDGRPLPPPGDVAYYGHSVGRYEGNDLIVETANFTFDPNGLDYQLQVPSSWAKRVTERYSLIETDRLRMVLTVEDPVFLTRPYTETLEYERTDQEIEWITDCDLVSALFPLSVILPRYPDE